MNNCKVDDDKTDTPLFFFVVFLFSKLYKKSRHLIMEGSGNVIISQISSPLADWSANLFWRILFPFQINFYIYK